METMRMIETPDRLKIKRLAYGIRIDECRKTIYMFQTHS